MVQSLERAFAVLESFRDREAQGITRIVESTGLPKTTVHRIVRTLTELGYLEQDPRTAEYRLGLRFLSLARASAGSLDLRRFAQSAMDALYVETGESVYLGVREGTAVVFIDEKVSLKPVRVGSSIGLRAPLHATAAGKAILAHLPAAELDEILAGLELEAYTSNTVADKAALRRELEAVRRNGYAVNDQEWVEDACYIAAPVLERPNAPVGALTVGAPAGRLPKARWDEVGEKVKRAAALVSQALGGGRETPAPFAAAHGKTGNEG